MSMKKGLLASLLALSLVLTAGAASAQIGADDCPTSLTSPYTPMPASSGGTAVGAFPSGAGFDSNTAALVGSFNFCGALDTVYCSLDVAAGLLPEIAQFQGLVLCATADINGTPDLNATVPVTPNGIPDGQYELAVIAEVLNTPSFNQNGLTHAEVLAAFDANFEFIRELVIEALFNVTLKSTGQKDITPIVSGLAPYLVDSLSYVLAGYVIVGDADTFLAVDALFGLLGDLGITPPSPEDLTPVSGYFGPADDADGDSLDNLGEFNASSSGPDYVQRALTPSGGEGEGEGEGEVGVRIIGSGFAEVGGRIELSVITEGITGITGYEWVYGGVQQAETGPVLVIEPVPEPQGSIDGGGTVAVTVTVTFPGKATLTSPPFIITVVPANGLPVAGGIGLAIFAGACALAGAVGIRRKR